MNLPKIAATIALSLTAAAAASAQTSQAPIVGFTSTDAQHQRELESKAASLASPANADSLSRELSLEPHMAGTPAQARTRDIFARELKKYGISPEVRTYSIYMPHPTGVHLYRVSPSSGRAIAAGRSDCGRHDVVQLSTDPHIQRLRSCGRRDRRRDLCQLRSRRGLRDTRLDGHLGEGQDRRCALRSLISRYQGARSREAWRARAHHLQRSCR